MNIFPIRNDGDLTRALKRFYEGSCNLAVFSSESEAENFVRDIMGDDIELIYDIEEWDLDDPLSGRSL